MAALRQDTNGQFGNLDLQADEAYFAGIHLGDVSWDHDPKTPRKEVPPAPIDLLSYLRRDLHRLGRYVHQGISKARDRLRVLISAAFYLWEHILSPCMSMVDLIAKEAISYIRSQVRPHTLLACGVICAVSLMTSLLLRGAGSDFTPILPIINGELSQLSSRVTADPTRLKVERSSAPTSIPAPASTPASAGTPLATSTVRRVRWLYIDPGPNPPYTVRLRESPGLDGRVLASLPKGTKLQAGTRRFTRDGYTWQEVWYGKVRGYVATEYLSRRSPPAAR